jgi:hypothetical protein
MTTPDLVKLAPTLSAAERYKLMTADCMKAMHRATGFAPGTIHAAKRGLVSKGFVTILNERNKKRTNTYDLSLLWEKLEGLTGQQSSDAPDRKAETGENPQEL